VRAGEGGPQVLLTRRAIEPWRGRWDVPGGFLRNGEPPEAGLAREMAEELSIELLRPELAAVEIDEYPRPDVPREARFTLNLFYLCTPQPGREPRPGDDVSEARWLRLSEGPAEVAFASNRRVLARLGARIGEYLREGTGS